MALLSHRLIESARNEARRGASGMIAALAFFTRVSLTSADGSADGDEGWPSDDGDPESGQQTSRRMEPWGLHGRPATGIQSLLVRVLGGAAQGLRAGIWTGSHGRQDLASGETQLYCIATGAEVYLDKNGAVFVTSASGQLIKVAGGTDFMVKGSTYRNAEHTFNQALQTFATAMATGWTAMATAWTALGVAVPAAATLSTTAATAATAAATAATTAATAAGTMEAGASNYLSTIAKVG